VTNPLMWRTIVPIGISSSVNADRPGIIKLMRPRIFMRHSKKVGVVFSAMVFFLSLVTPAAADNAAVRYEPYESRTPAFGLLKPANWRVRSEPTPESLAIAVSNPTGTLVVQTVFMLNRMHANAIAALSAQVKKAKSQYSDLQLSEVVECKNLSCI